jgi:hypothetical protein
MIDRYVEDFAKAYELDGEQRQQVVARLQQIKEEQEEYNKAHAEESRKLRGEMSQVWQARRAGQTVDEQRWQEVTRQMRELSARAPLLNQRRIADEVDKLLPSEQVAKGRPRWNEARQERLRQWSDRLEESREGRVPDSERLTASGVDRWQQYVDTFCKAFDLDEAQRSTAQSMLRDLQQRRDKYIADHADELEAASRMDDRSARHQQVAVALAPVNALFEDLKGRLDRVPTSAQIDAVRRRAATQPTSAPAATATRPTDMIRMTPDRPFSRLRDRVQFGRQSASGPEN